MTLDSAAKILREAISEIQPRYIVSMVSGGKDSAASHAVTQELGVKIDLIIHGNTRCGIPETSQFVEKTYGANGTDLAIADAGTAYQDYVLRKGFFGKGHRSHSYAYHLLKAQPFRTAISKHLRKKRRGIDVLILTGARKSESANRQKNLKILKREPGRPGNVWVNPLHYWTAGDRDDYLASRQVPINPVAKALCRSGECMCGTMQSKAERAEAAVLYPHWGRWLTELEAEAKRLHGFGWGDPFPKPRDARQGDMFQPMCIGCGAGA